MIYKLDKHKLHLKDGLHKQLVTERLLSFVRSFKLSIMRKMENIIMREMGTNGLVCSEI